jgi:hypothetical protein
MMRVLRIGVVAIAVAGNAACSPLAASCIARQKTGPVASASGTIGAGETLVHRLPYGTDGSQNNIAVSWSNQSGPDASQLQFYATRTACENFTPANATGACAVLARGGWTEGRVAPTLVIASGRGNPDVLGTPAEYKLWVIGDSKQGASYSVTTTWFYGPDC